jgi:hypothetical protein
MELEFGGKKIIYPDAVSPHLIYFLEHIGAADFSLPAELLVYVTSQYFKYVFVGADKIIKKCSYRKHATQHQSGRFHQDNYGLGEFISQLKAYKRYQVGYQKAKRQHAVIYTKFGKWISLVTQEAKAVSVKDVTGYVKSHTKSA